jgi:hypothetical protein
MERLAAGVSCNERACSMVESLLPVLLKMSCKVRIKQGLSGRSNMHLTLFGQGHVA